MQTKQSGHPALPGGHSEACWQALPPAWPPGHRDLVMLPIEVVSAKDPFLLRARETFNIEKFKTEKRCGVSDPVLKVWAHRRGAPRHTPPSQAHFKYPWKDLLAEKKRSKLSSVVTKLLRFKVGHLV